MFEYMEEWKQVEGYTGLYEVSNMGRVRSIPHFRYGRNWKNPGGYRYMTRERILKQKCSRNGYMQVGLTGTDHKRRYFLVHSLVASAFIGPRPTGFVINHKNEVKTDNRIVNLEYCTQQYNGRYSNAIPVESYDLKTGMTVKRYGAGVDVVADGHDVGAVLHCCHHDPKYLSHHGLGWRISHVKAAC